MNKDKVKLFDQVFFESFKYRLTRRKVSEALRKMRSWLNYELRPQEMMPAEFKHLEEKKPETVRDTWNKYFQI